jgi:thioredoxin reductase (NADPH)
MEEVELVIIGAGPSGLFATFCAGLRAIKSVTLESLSSYGGQIPELYPNKMVYDMQGIPKILANTLAGKMYEQAQMFKNLIVFDSTITDIKRNPDKTFNIEVNGEDKYKTNAVLICAGVGNFTPNKLNVDGEDQYQDKGVYYAVKSVSNFKNNDVIVVGGGDSALDYALQVEPIAKSVIISQHNGVLKAAENSIITAKNKPKIKIMLNTEIKKIIGDGKNVTKANITDNVSKETKEIDIDSIIIAIGHKASPNIFKSLRLEITNRYIRVDTGYKTNIDGIYAAGDIANVADEPKFALLAVGGAEAYVAINNIKKYLSPTSSLFGGHSSSLDI